MKIKITEDQLNTLADSLGDCKTVELEIDNNGNLIVFPDGLEDERYEITPDGEIG